MTSGIDRAMFGYYGSKLAAEEAVTGSGVRWTILRATQFHDLVLTAVQAVSKMPVVPVPGVRFQPVDTERGGGPARGARAGSAGRAGVDWPARARTRCESWSAGT